MTDHVYAPGGCGVLADLTEAVRVGSLLTWWGEQEGTLDIQDLVARGGQHELVVAYRQAWARHRHAERRSVAMLVRFANLPMVATTHHLTDTRSHSEDACVSVPLDPALPGHLGGNKLLVVPRRLWAQRWAGLWSRPIQANSAMRPATTGSSSPPSLRNCSGRLALAPPRSTPPRPTKETP